MIRNNNITSADANKFLTQEQTIAFFSTNDDYTSYGIERPKGLPEDMWLAKELFYTHKRRLYELAVYVKNSKSIVVAESSDYQAIVNEYNSLNLLEFYKDIKNESIS